eukprot:jgi/Mesen1/343/ME980861C10581
MKKVAGTLKLDQ